MGEVAKRLFWGLAFIVMALIAVTHDWGTPYEPVVEKPAETTANMPPNPTTTATTQPPQFPNGAVGWFGLSTWPAQFGGMVKVNTECFPGTDGKSAQQLLGFQDNGDDLMVKYDYNGSAVWTTKPQAEVGKTVLNATPGGMSAYYAEVPEADKATGTQCNDWLEVKFTDEENNVHTTYVRVIGFFPLTDEDAQQGVRLRLSPAAMQSEQAGLGQPLRRGNPLRLDLNKAHIENLGSDFNPGGGGWCTNDLFLLNCQSSPPGG